MFCIFYIKSHQQSEKSPSEGDGPDPEEQFKQLFMAVDKDGNGKISPAEALEFWQTKSKMMDPEELKKKLDKFNAKTLEEAVERGFKKVDKDGDGSVSVEGKGSRGGGGIQSSNNPSICSELKSYMQS